ncbi:hypothetical protein AAG570_007256 [Ranatra chinensis]|uniref:Cyclic nucleotide-binding domain-containing protein n=1 Tax=Ranatra chinensis TaxID=642074 RepID=A0ABD0XY14_9HEMI
MKADVPSRELRAVVVFLVTLLFYAFTPFRLAFMWDDWTFVLIQTAIDALFLAEIGTNLVDPYFVVHSGFGCPLEVTAGRYLRSYFLPDLLSSLPYELLCWLGALRGDVCKYTSFMYGVKLLTLAKAVNYAELIFKSLRISWAAKQLVYLLFTVMLSIHWHSCLLAILAPMPKPAHFVQGVVAEEMFAYLTAVHLTSSITILAPYKSNDYTLRDRTPTADIVLVIARYFITAYVVAQAMYLAESVYSSEFAHMDLLSQIDALAADLECRHETTRKVKAQLGLLSSRRRPMAEVVVSWFTDHVQADRTMVEYPGFRKKVFDMDIDRSLFTDYVLPSIEKMLCFKGEVVLRKDTPTSLMYYLEYGCVGVFSADGLEICRLYDNSYFGDVFLNSVGQGSIFYFVALELSTIVKLNWGGLNYLFGLEPDACVELKIAFEKRRKRLQEIKNVLDEEGF